MCSILDLNLTTKVVDFLIVVILKLLYTTPLTSTHPSLIDMLITICIPNVVFVISIAFSLALIMAGNRVSYDVMAYGYLVSILSFSMS